MIVPVLDGEDQLKRSLPPLLAHLSGDVAEVIVVDDGSSDGSSTVSEELGATLLVTGERARGPAYARNIGAARATGDVLVFVDADVVVAGDAIQRIATAFADPDVSALFGSYDASPDHRGFASLYMNLRHHYAHRIASRDAETFWAGLGAVRRRRFESVDGFDAAKYALPSIEDIDLGCRLRAAGHRIDRDPTIQGKHLKRWSWRQVITTDILRRAVPWSDLMLDRPGAFTDLNVARTEQVKAGIAAVFLATAVTTAVGIWSAWVLAATTSMAALANLGLIKVFVRGGGPLFAVVGATFHQVHLTYSATTYVVCRIRRALSAA